MTETQIEVVKQWLKNKKEFSPLEVIEALEKENAELKEQLKNNPYVQLLQKEKSEMAEDFVKQIENYKMSENESKEIIAELKEQNKTILEDNDTLNKWIDELKAQNKSLKNTLQAIATDTNEHITHNVAQNELDKWEAAE